MIKVAVFDDDVLARKALCSMVSRLPDCQVCLEASSGKNACERIWKKPVDLVFMASLMPEVDGLTVLREVKSTWPDLPVVMLSAYEDVGLVREAIKYGASDFLIKPITPQMVERVLRPLREQFGLYRSQAARLADFAGDSGFEKAYAALGETAKNLSQDHELIENYERVEAVLLAGYAPWGAPAIPERAQMPGITNEAWVTLKWRHTLCGVYEKKATAQNALMASILEALFSDLALPVKLANISGQVHLSEGYLSDLFKETMGISIIDYGHIGRIGRAAYWLQKEDLSVQECCDRLGYRGRSYFSKLFYKYTGTHFSDYKKLHERD